MWLVPIPVSRIGQGLIFKFFKNGKSHTYIRVMSNTLYLIPATCDVSSHICGQEVDEGFSTEFFLKAWSIVGSDVVKANLYSFETQHLPCIINSTAIALVPEQDCPTEMTHFRPIWCCNVLYKCISKLLASRLKHVLPSTISPSQTAFKIGSLEEYFSSISGLRQGDPISPSLCHSNESSYCLFKERHCCGWV